MKLSFLPSSFLLLLDLLFVLLLVEVDGKAGATKQNPLIMRGFLQMGQTCCTAMGWIMLQLTHAKLETVSHGEGLAQQHIDHVSFAILCICMMWI